MLLTELKKQVNKMGNILGRVAMKRDEYWQLILGKLKKLENDECTIITPTIEDENIIYDNTFSKNIIINVNNFTNINLIIPDDPLIFKNNTSILINSLTGNLTIKTLGNLSILKSTSGTSNLTSGFPFSRIFILKDERYYYFNILVA